MRGPFRFLGSKVALALIGTCLIGGTSAYLAAKITLSQEASLHQSSTSLSVANGGGRAATAVSTAAGSATATASGTSVGDSPTATSIVLPTASPQPRPTATATPAPGQACTLSGRITALPSNRSLPNTFTVHSNGVSHTIDVTSSTSFTGSATSFAGLQVFWIAQVTGITQQDLSCQASQVHSSVDN